MSLTMRKCNFWHVLSNKDSNRPAQPHIRRVWAWSVFFVHMKTFAALAIQDAPSEDSD